MSKLKDWNNSLKVLSFFFFLFNLFLPEEGAMKKLEHSKTIKRWLMAGKS
jgi:hypothetical protein